jgi:Cdc6-like AAA superfamily ATPase
MSRPSSREKTQQSGEASTELSSEPQAQEPAVHAKQPWAKASVERRREKLRALFVERDIEARIVEVIKEALADRHLHAEAQNVAIYGETGVGKSEIAKRILAANPERRDPVTGCIVRPVLYTDVRNSSTPKAAATAMLVQLATFQGQPIEDHDKLIASTAAMSVPDITRRVKAQMMGQGVILSILDEFHNTITDRGAVRLNRIAEWVKDFAKSKSRSAAKPDGDLSETIVFVLVGTRKIKSIIEPTINAELASIAPYRIEVPRYGYGTEEEKKAFHDFLEELDRELPFDEYSDLDLPEMAEKLYIASFGLLRQLGIIVVKAADLAIRDGSDRIYEHHLHAAVELKRGVLESPMISEDSSPEERFVVQNPFKAPVLPTRERSRRRSGWTE